MGNKIKGNKSLDSFLKYSFKHKWTMIGVVLLSATTSVAGALPAWLSKYLIDDVFVSRDQKMMVYVLTGIFLATLVKVISGYYDADLRHRRSTRIQMLESLRLT